MANEHAKESGAVSVLKKIIPQKGDSAGEAVRKIVFLVSIAVVIVCLVLILVDAGENASDQKMNEEVRDLKENSVNGNISLTDEQIEQLEEEAPGILDEYKALYEENHDIVGWIKINETPIDYPVMQSDDNEYYLYRNFYREDSKLGSIFADYHVKFTPTSRPNNTVLYGHNIASGEYFAKLTNYYPNKYGSLDFYLRNPTVQFDTIYEKGTYKIFGAMFINTEEEHGEVFSYYRQRKFESATEFYDFMCNVLDRSCFYTDVDVEYGDEILTLSTCYYPMGNSVDSRFVVFARRVRDGESAEVDVSKAYINKDPLYFEYYRQVNGLGEWGGRTWDTSKLIGFDEYAASHPNDTIANLPADNSDAA